MDLKLATFNVNNLFLYEDDVNIYHRVSTGEIAHPPKPKDKVQQLAEVILESEADILFLQEVGGIESLDVFNERYLKDQFYTSLIEGNSDRGIENGYLIKKSLPFQFEHFTHRQRELDLRYPNHDENELISRDFAELRLLDPTDETPILIFYGVHLKSKLDKFQLDFQGINKRGAEAKLLVKVIKAMEEKYPNVPQIILGDLNNTIGRQAPELDSLLSLGHLDCLEVTNCPPEDRGTFIHFDRETNRREFFQLDYILLPENLHRHTIEAEVHYFKDGDDKIYPLPKTIYERYAMASDHFMVMTTIELPNY